jgi:hypothetical protein
VVRLIAEVVLWLACFLLLLLFFVVVVASSCSCVVLPAPAGPSMKRQSDVSPSTAASTLSIIAFWWSLHLAPTAHTRFGLRREETRPELINLALMLCMHVQLRLWKAQLGTGDPRSPKADCTGDSTVLGRSPAESWYPPPYTDLESWRVQTAGAVLLSVLSVVVGSQSFCCTYNHHSTLQHAFSKKSILEAA